MIRFLTALLLLVAANAAAAPPPPGSFEAIATSSSSISLYWLCNSPTESFRIWRDATDLGLTAPGADQSADINLAEGTTHTYRIRGEEGGAASAERSYTERTFSELPAGPNGERLGRCTEGEATFDVVVVQASSGGVAAAIEAAKRGLRVALVEPTTRLGGMPVNGLSATDLRRPEHASGFFIRFRDTVRSLYAAEGVKSEGLQYEPRIAQQAMKSLLYAEPNITVFRRTRLGTVHTVAVSGRPLRHVDSVMVEELLPDGAPSGKRAILKARFFIDATDCGDLAAWAGAPFRLGREKRTAREPHAGVIYYDRANDRLLPGSTGAGDRRLQSYTYLLTVKDYGPGADKTIPMPPGYRKEDFAHTPAWKESWAVTSGRMPFSKLELNQHPEGGDLQGINYHYPLGSYTERAGVEEQYRRRVLGYLYYIQTEQGMKQIGLPDDEYRDTGGFPPLLYVREGRRIVGEETPQEADIREAAGVSRPDSLGLGDYPMDSHAVRPKTDWDRPDMGEGEWWLYRITPVHQLPLGVMISPALDNVFVTTAVSSTHVSYGTYRLEPVRMAFGEAAGTAAALCIHYGLNAQDLPARQVQLSLLPFASSLASDPGIALSYLPGLSSGDPLYPQLQYLAARGFLREADIASLNKPVTGSDLAKWLTLLAARAAGPATGDDILTATSTRAYMGRPADPAGLDALRALPPEREITRGEAAHWLYRIAPLHEPATPSLAATYSDIPDAELHNEADALLAQGFDSILWDGSKALGTGRTRLLRPDEPITRYQLLGAIYLIQLGLGPLFDDDPVDRR